MPGNFDGSNSSATYHITVNNPDGVSKGIRKMTVDGKAVLENTLPLFDGGVHTVEVVMGSK